MRITAALVVWLVAAPLAAEPCNPYRGCVPDPLDPYWAVTSGPGSALDPSALSPPAWYTTPSL